MAATDELTLLERVFLRIGSAETDEQLQNAVSKFLLPVLLKLSSQQEGVRKKVMELLVHINKRIKCRPKIQLPVEALLLQYGDPAATSFVTNFTIIYIKMGFPRLDVEKQASLIPCILSGIEGKPQSHQESLLIMLMPVFADVQIPLDSQKCKNMFGLHERPLITKLLLELMLDVLLLPYGSFLPKQPSVQVSVTVDAGPGGSSQATVSTAPPGLSESTYKRIIGENPFSPEELEKTKLGIAKFLGGGFLPEEDVIVPLIIASSDTRHSVVNTADMELKRLAGAININNVAVISKLYAIFLGTSALKNKQPPVKPDMVRTPANTRIRLRILPYLLKSREAAIYFPASIQMAFDCLYGVNSNPKLKLMAVQFVHHICFNCNEAKLTPFAPVLLSGMVKLIAESKEDAKLRSLAYVAVGKLGSKLPSLVTKDLSLLQTFFDAMSDEGQDTRLAIQEALLIMSSAFKNLNPANLNTLQAMLTSSMEKPEPQVRLLAVQYAATVFPSDHIPSRYLLLLAAGDMKEEVYSEAAKTLRTVPTKGQPNEQRTEAKFPPFPDLVKFIDERAQERLKSRHKYVTGVHHLPYTPATCTEMLTYMRLSMAHSAGLNPSLEFSQQIQEQAPDISKYVRRLLNESPGEKGVVQLYINFIKQILTVISGAATMYYLLEIVAVAPEILSPYFVPQLDWIKNFMFSNKEDMRSNASQLYAIVVSQGLNEEDFALVIKELAKKLHDKDIPLLLAAEFQHGAMSALGYALGRKSKLLGKGILETIPGASEAVEATVGFLGSTHAPLLTIACIALGEIGRNGMLPIPNEGANEKACSKLFVVNRLTEIAKSSKYVAKVQEKAALAASYLCIGDDNFPHQRVVMEKLLGSAGEVKDVDLHFTIGESLAWAALRSASPAGRDFWTVSEDEFKESILKKDPNEEEGLSWLLNEIFNKYVASLNPHIRQAACVWLLSLLKHCSNRQTVKNHLDTLQKVFINLLSESNEMTQDLASRGLGLIYECSEEDQKKDLVSVLVDALMVGRRSAQQLTDDSKIFDEGALGTAPHGGGLSTYKELCSLASDLNQPDLVYKFMNLANHNAIWNSKKGAAFGFGFIATKASEQLEPYLPKIIPKLFRYQFDPNSKIQNSMSRIWEAIVPDPRKMMNLYAKEILADLKVNMTNNMWRTRESSCYALAELLRGHLLDEVVNDLPELWEICFRVRDDIKESVRDAADKALQCLNRFVIRLCEKDTGPRGQLAISSILPVLLKSGLMSSVIEVRTISLETLSEIGKYAGVLLKPHIPLLTVSLLESLSALEKQELNYLSVRLGNQQNTQEKLDSARISAAKSSPMMDTINKCLPFIDEEVLTELVPRLIDLIKNSVGLSTKAGCAHFIISLSHQCSVDTLQPHTGKLLAALLFGLNDRSGAVRKSYALAIGRLVKAAKDSSVEKLIDRLKTSYIEKDEAAAQLTCGQVLLAIAKQSPDVLKNHAVQALPLAFIAMHAPKQLDTLASDQKRNEIWEEIWTDLTPGTEAGIRLYLSEIVELVQIALQSPSWTMKAQGAAAISTVANKLKSSLTFPHLGVLLKTVLSGLSGRTWDGKENLLRAVADICVNFREEILNMNDDDSIKIKEVVTIMLKECAKDNLSYKKEAIKCSANIIHAYKEDAFDQMFGLVKSIIKKNGDDDHDSDSEEKSRRASPATIELQEIMFEAIGKSWPENTETQEKFYLEFSEFLCYSYDSHVLKVQISILKAMNHFIDRLYLFEAADSTAVDTKSKAIISNIVPRLCVSAVNIKSSAVRIEIFDIFYKIVSKLNAKNKLGLFTVEQMEEMRNVTTEITKVSQTELREKGNQLIKLLTV